MSNESTIISDSADAEGLRTPHQDVAGAVEKKRERYLLAVFLVWYALLMYGGVRSPDSEVVFQTGQAIADHGTTAVDGIWGWPGFGIARGVDGRHYSVFGPLQSVLLVPFIYTAEFINGTGWYRNIPVHPSLLIDQASFDAALHGSQVVGEPHALRMLVASYNVILGALAVILFYRIGRKLHASLNAALFGAILFGAGSLFQAYAGTMFTEPLSTALILASFWYLLKAGTDFVPKDLVIAGCFAGLSIVAHVANILFVPFLVLYAFASSNRSTNSAAIQRAAAWCFGFVIPVLILGWFNYDRFGSFFETGRTVDPADIEKFGYGYFVMPWVGLKGLLLSQGKSLLLYSPAIVPGVILLAWFFKRNRLLAWTVCGIGVTRLLFIASRFDWAGGFCLGPRLLVPIIPFLLIPFVLWFDEQLKLSKQSSLWGAVAVLVACVIQQWYFAIGEVFMFYFHARLDAKAVGISIVKDWVVYFDGKYSPLWHILESARSPFLLSWVPLSNSNLFAVGTLVITAGLGFLWWKIFRDTTPSSGNINA